MPPAYSSILKRRVGLVNKVQATEDGGYFSTNAKIVFLMDFSEFTVTIKVCADIAANNVFD